MIMTTVILVVIMIITMLMIIYIFNVADDDGVSRDRSEYFE